MLFKLFLLFIIVPVAELALLIKIGTFIGTFNTILIVILTAIIGAHMVKSEGIGVMYRIRKNMDEGIFPAEELIDGMMILIAGALLLTPGFLTDSAGFLMVFPVSRDYIKKIARRYIKKKMSPDEIEIHLS
ncbi:MAG: FxsA family protein [Deferribacteres bacterium]|nr:FxsA family protein [Deferribacteres bacterium]